MKYRKLSLCAIILMIAGPLYAEETSQQRHAHDLDWSHRDKSLAFGVHPFLTPRPQVVNGTRRYFKPDFAPEMTDSANWEDISRIAGEYEMYIELLQGAKAFPAEITLSALAETLNNEKMTVTFQVGGARPMKGQCAGSGLPSAQEDIALLKTWQQAGGRLDKLIVDNSFAKYFNAKTPACYSSPDQLMELSTSELSLYFTAISQAFPGIKLGVTDGFAQFQVTDDHGARDSTKITYNATVQMPTFDFKTYMHDLVGNMRNTGLVLDEFVMDCAEAYASDASQYPKSKYIYEGRNYGRLIAGQRVMEALGIGSGVYWEVFPPSSDTAIEEQKYHDIGIEQIKAFYKFGGHPAHNRLTYWTSIPDITGPETAPNTALNDIRDAAHIISTLDLRR